jgi:secreted PhoX family phosphatase
MVMDTSRFDHDDSDGEVVNPSDNPTFESVLAARLGRRAFLTGAAAGLVVVAASPLGRPREAAGQGAGGFAPVAGSTEDRVIVPPGHRVTVLLRWGDPIFPGAPELDPTAQTAARQLLQFGYDNDFIGYLPLPPGGTSSTRGLLGVNHENAREIMWPGWDGKHESKTREMVDVEIAAHGFTVVEIARDASGAWRVVKESPYNRRITGATPMALGGPAAGAPLVRTKADPAGTRALGTLNNCAGGVTPWGTFLTGEENIQSYFAGKLDVVPDPTLQAIHKRFGIGTGRGRYVSWGRFHERFDLAKEPNEPNRFGWIVEIDPYDAKSAPVKHTALGRMAHEGATVIVAKDGRPVVYMGDDARFEYMYKFVAAGRVDPASRGANTKLLDSGTLYAARFRDDGTGEWLPLVQGQGALTEAKGFRSQADVVVNARAAADAVGATKMDRPEDVEPNPKTGKIYAALTGNDRRKPDQVDRANPRPDNKFGHILELVEDGDDHTATRFRWNVFVLAGDPKNADHKAFYQGHVEVSPLAAPDNLAFDDAGRMWVATDGVDDALGWNDGVWVLPTEGPERGRARQFLSAPPGAEVCGPAFTPDNRTFFVAIQHPGLTDKATYEKPGSRFPDYRPDMPPRPSVLAISREDGGKVGT